METNELVLLKKTWIKTLGFYAVVLLIPGILLSIGLALLDIVELGYSVFVTFLVSAFLESVSIWCLYNYISCPSCGHKLAKFKNGKNMPINQAYRALESGKECRSCHWKP